MKRTGAIIFLFIWLINFSGASVFFLMQIHRQKRTMRELLASLPEKKLVHLTLSSAAFEKLRVDKHELKINGRMFDIAFKKLTGDVVEVYGLYDEKEDTLLASLRQESRRQSADPSAASSIKGFMTLQFIAVAEIATPSQCVVPTCVSSDIPDLYTSFSSHPDGPPPRIVS